MCTEKSIEELILNAKCRSSADYEKQMKIVDAVNGSKASPPPICAKAVLEHDNYGFVFIPEVTSKSACTIEEYNQCIEEMKYHYDIPKWCSYNRADKELLTVENSDQSFYEKEKFVYGQDVYVNNTVYSNKKFKFGCLELNGENAMLFTENGYMVYPVAGISSKPFKSKEDIELEEAKRKQVDDYSYMYSHCFKSMGAAKKVFSEMQECGRLAEIILPLEKS